MGIVEGAGVAREFWDSHPLFEVCWVFISIHWEVLAGTTQGSGLRFGVYNGSAQLPYVKVN